MKKLLPTNYMVNEHDVYCGRGSQCFNHLGNQRYRQMIVDHLEPYMKATSKFDKSSIIDSILATIRNNSRQCQTNTGGEGGGGFVKKDEKTGRFYEIGDFAAVRRKIVENTIDFVLPKLFFFVLMTEI
jgi:hypothetical protein